LQELTKIRQLKTGKMLPGMTSLDFHLDIQMVESEFVVNRMRTWIHHATTVQAGGGGVMVWGTFSWHTLGPLVPIGHHLNATAYLSIVSDHVHPFMATMYPNNPLDECRSIQLKQTLLHYFPVIIVKLI